MQQVPFKQNHLAVAQDIKSMSGELWVAVCISRFSAFLASRKQGSYIAEK